jgi:hypothetical protein
MWASFGRSGYDAELTSQVLEAKARRAEGSPFVLEPRPSRICPSVRWISTLDAGGLTIAPEVDPFPPSTTHTGTRRFRIASQAPP